MPEDAHNLWPLPVIDAHRQTRGVSPRRSVILSVTARDARTRLLSLSSYFIFISKNPAVKERRRAWDSISFTHMEDGGEALRQISTSFTNQSKFMNGNSTSLFLSNILKWLDNVRNENAQNWEAQQRLLRVADGWSWWSIVWFQYRSWWININTHTHISSVHTHTQHAYMYLAWLGSTKQLSSHLTS